MKKFLIVIGLIALTGVGCSSSTTTNVLSSGVPQASAAFNTDVTFSIGESKTFQDGIKLTLTAINDSRCPFGVQCIWAGELSSTFVFYGVDGVSQEFTLGTVRAKQVTVKDYVISLTNAATDQTSVTVAKK